MNLSWLEISTSALLHNLKTFRGLLGSKVFLAPNVKGNAYGHGLVECAQIIAKEVDYLCVNSPMEARKLRQAGIKSPLLIVGYTPLSELEAMVDLKVDLTIYNLETLHCLGKLKKEVKVHLKIETGNHRQGIEIYDLRLWICDLKKYKNINVKGISTHFANLEDRLSHQYALEQLELFKEAIQILEANGIQPAFKHCANSAAILMFPEAYFNFARLGIGIYGLWPSEKTKKATQALHVEVALQPAMIWKTIVAQIKPIKKGATVGYGCTYKMPKNGTIAVLPVGYYDGYVRAHSNKGYVLIKGKKAPVIGRICMNMMMVDISDISNVKLEEEVILLGKQGNEEVTAEMLADWSGTINYEVVARINDGIERKIVK